jgi:Ca2+/Na+ antiporter
MIDWWISARETVFMLFYLFLMSFALYGNKVELWKACILFIVYIVHIILMKYSSKYEVAIKQMLANYLEIKELKRIAQTDMKRFHRNMKT